MASRYKILKDQVEPDRHLPVVGVKPGCKPKKRHYIRASMLSSERHFNWMETTIRSGGIIKNVTITERKVSRIFSKQFPDEGYELIRAEFDIINPKGEWEQENFITREIPGNKGFEIIGKYNNEFKIIYPEKLDVLKNLNVGALKEHLETFSEEEMEEALGLPDPDLCPVGGKHEWGTDGVFATEFCKKCYISKKIELSLQKAERFFSRPKKKRMILDIDKDCTQE